METKEELIDQEKMDINECWELPLANDFHVHLRDGDMLPGTIYHTAMSCSCAVVMPNLADNPILTFEDGIKYKERIMDHCKKQGITEFDPLMTLYLTHETTPQDIYEAHEAGIVAVKCYPMGATTHSKYGVRFPQALEQLCATFSAMAAAGMPLLLHGEVTDPSTDVFDREEVFIDHVLHPLLIKFPKLLCVLEHVSTAYGVDFVNNFPENRVAATITAHHALFTRTDLLGNTFDANLWCKPILKTHADRIKLCQVIAEGNPKFFCGSDSAPHTVVDKKGDAIPAGCFTSPDLIAMYLQALTIAGHLRFEGDDYKQLNEHNDVIMSNFVKFIAYNGAAFYHLDKLLKIPPPVRLQVRYARQGIFPIPEHISLGATSIVTRAMKNRMLNFTVKKLKQ